MTPRHDEIRSRIRAKTRAALDEAHLRWLDQPMDPERDMQLTLTSHVARKLLALPTSPTPEPQGFLAEQPAIVVKELSDGEADMWHD